MVRLVVAELLNTIVLLVGMVIVPPPDTAPFTVMSPVLPCKTRLLLPVASVELNNIFAPVVPVVNDVEPVSVTPFVKVIASLVVVMLPAVLTVPVPKVTAPSAVIAPAAVIVVPP